MVDKERRDEVPKVSESRQVLDEKSKIENEKEDKGEQEYCVNIVHFENDHETNAEYEKHREETKVEDYEQGNFENKEIYELEKIKPGFNRNVISEQERYPI